MKKFLIPAALIAASSLALATGQSFTSHAQNLGGINNTVNSAASVNGVGSSVSQATSSGSASNKVTITTTVNPVKDPNCVTTSGGLNITGVAATSSTGSAWNVSNGAGATGSASAHGNAASDASGSANYSGPGQSLRATGSLGQNAATAVTAGMNQGGYASAGNSAAFDVTAVVGSSKCTTGGCGNPVSTTTSVFGNTEDNKTSHSYANNGSMTVDNVVLSQGDVNSSAVSNVTVSGQFYDPITSK